MGDEPSDHDTEHRDPHQYPKNPQQQQPHHHHHPSRHAASQSRPSPQKLMEGQYQSIKRENLDHDQTTTISTSVSNDLLVPYTSSLLTVLPFSAQHSHPIFPTRGQNRRQGWYRSKSVASQALTEITGVDYTTTCWYDVEQLQSVVRESISLQELTALKSSLEDLTEPSPLKDS